MALNSQRPQLVKRFIGAVEDEWELYSDRSQDYTPGLPIGFGASSVVYAAHYHPPNDKDGSAPPPIPVALKVVNLERLPSHSLALLQRETTLMSLSKHPNVLRVRGSWMDGHKLYIAMRLMNKGSAADIMRYGWPDGLEEEVIRCILYQGLQGLNYLHINGFIHRDIKAANLLIDDDGTVLLGDLGVAANLADDNSHSTSLNRAHSITAASAVSEPTSPHPRPSLTRDDSSSSLSRRVVLVDAPGHSVVSRPALIKRKSFVGTPCWMAPELIQGHQYDSAADIWSFGITALELALGRPPRSREPPQKVLLKTIQDEPPTLDREGGAYKYSRAFKEMIDRCLAKNPSKRPSAEELLQMQFFKNVKKKGYLVNAILKNLPPLTSRQERRIINNTLVHPSVASWDFATTIHPRSPSRRSGAESPVSESIFEMEAEPFDFDSPLPTVSRPVSLSYSMQHPVPEEESSKEGDDSDSKTSEPSTPSGSDADQGSSPSLKPRAVEEPIHHSPIPVPQAHNHHHHHHHHHHHDNSKADADPPSTNSLTTPPSMSCSSSPGQQRQPSNSSSVNSNKLSSSPSQQNLWTRLKNKTKNTLRSDSEEGSDTKLSLVRTFSRRR